LAKLCPKLSDKQREVLTRALKQAGRGSDLKRIQAVFLLDRGEGLSTISAVTLLQRSRIFSLREAYLKRGLKALLYQGKARSWLTRRQIKELTRTLHNPNSLKNLGYADSSWTTGKLSEYIRLAYGVTYKSRTSYYLIFKRIKFTYHKPGKVYVKRDEAEVKAWKEEAYPLLREAWDDKETEILASDEMILSTSTTLQKIWLPKGEYPKIEVQNGRKNLSIYGFLNLKTGREHAFITERQTMGVTRRILGNVRRIYPRKLNRGNKLTGKKLLILWDNPGWHRGSAVTDYIKKDKRIKIIYFPKYSPDLNPQEHVWKEGRSKVTHNTFMGNLSQTAKDFVSYLNSAKFNYNLLGFTSSPI